MTALSRMTAKLGDSLKHTCRCSLILYCQAAHNKLFQLQRTKIPNTEVYGRILVAWNCLGPRLKPELVVVWERDSNNKSRKNAEVHLAWANFRCSGSWRGAQWTGCCELVAALYSLFAVAHELHAPIK